MKELIKGNLEMTADAIEEREKEMTKKKKILIEINASDNEWKRSKKKKGTPSKIGEIFYNVFFFFHIKTSRSCAGM